MNIKAIIFVCMCASLGLVLFLQQRSKRIAVEIVYDSAIAEMPIAKLKNARNFSEKEKEELFAWFSPLFAIEKATTMIKQNVVDPQIVLWFTDHYGQVPQCGAEWYKNQVMRPLAGTGAKFWLTDLAAWRFLSLREAKLMNSPDFAACIMPDGVADFSKAGFNSLMNDTVVVLNDISQLQGYGVLRANEFFRWLNQLRVTISELDRKGVDRIIRTELRSGAPSYSLRELGYSPLLLDVVSAKLNTNLLDANSTQIFPFLQFFEAVFYACKIAQQAEKEGKNECSIVFLLPNKEFTYYLVEGDAALFETFREYVSSMLALNQEFRSLQRVKIYFYPFSYGTEIRAQPFNEPAPFMKKDELIELLSCVS